MPRKATETAEAPRLSVIDRRLTNPFGSPSRDIPLQGEKRNWVVRTFCADAEHPNRHYDAVHRLGWVPLTKDDLAVSVESLGFVTSADGRIVRGPGGQEVLMAMPSESYAKIQTAKSQANTKSLKAGAVKESVSQAAAQEHGSEAGDHIHKHFSQREIVETI